MNLSIVVPVFNESKYIYECIQSLLSNSSEDFEIVISDNCSTDNTLEIIDKINDKRIMVVRQKIKISPVANYWSAVHAAKGKYIFSIGGDDYLESGVLDKVIPMLNGDSIIIGKMACFSDLSKKIFSLVNDEQYLSSMFDPKKNFIDSYLANFRDEIMYAFIKKTDILYTFGLIDNSLERFLCWQALTIFSSNNSANLIFYDEVILYKRYNKSEMSGNYTKDAHSSYVQSLYVFKAFASLYNSVYFFYVNKDVNNFVKIVFKNRVFPSKGGFLGINKDVNLFYGGPLLMFILSPIIDMARFVLSLKKKIDRKN